MAGTWRWNAAALLLTAGVGASVAAVQTVVAAARGDRPAVARPSHTAPPMAATAAPSPAARPAGQKLVALDPGHGGSNTGAKSVVAGVYEKHLTMLLAREVAKDLEERGI